MRRGFTEQKAFEMIEERMALSFEKLKDNMRIAHGLATSNYGRSFLTIAQQQAEHESRMKLLKMQQDLPKFIRSKELNALDPARLQLTKEQARNLEKPVDRYEPVLCKILG